MANIIRTAKSARDWKEKELEAYNIKINFQNATTFFNTPALPEPNINEELLTTVSAEDMVIESNRTLLGYLHYAMLPDDPELGESAVIDFAVVLFRALGYSADLSRSYIIRTRKTIQHLICGDYKNTILDVCVFDTSKDEIILLVQEDKDHGHGPDPLPRLIAQAIAAFQSNNNCRMMLGLDPLEDKVMPAIIMVNSLPMFFKVPITTELVKGVQHGDYPATPTIVLGHIPDIPLPRQSEGMRPLDNRRVILQCYEAFKQFFSV